MDIQKLLEPLAGSDGPCGPDLSYDRGFRGFMSSLKPPEDAMVQSSADEEAKVDGPKWSAIKKDAISLLSKTKDVRIAIALTQALLHTEGLVGLEKGLELVHGLLERYWDQLYPEIDEDDGDAQERMSAMVSLCDTATIVELRRTPLVKLSAQSKYCMRDIRIAKGEEKPVGSQKVARLSEIESAFAGCSLEQLQSSAGAAQACLLRADTIQEFLNAKGPGGQAANLDRLIGELNLISPTLAEALSRRQPVEPDDELGDAETDPEATMDSSTASVTPIARAPGRINSREDVLDALERISKYYEIHEPASPLPVLLKRCKELVPMSFLEVVENLAPTGLKELKVFEPRNPTG